MYNKFVVFSFKSFFVMPFISSFIPPSAVSRPGPDLRVSFFHICPEVLCRALYMFIIPLSLKYDGALKDFIMA